jgi:hypothetical protein
MLKLTWTAPAIPGQRIRLLDRLPGSAATIQRLTSKSRGSVTFRPGASLATSKHKIEADVFQNGLSESPPCTSPDRQYPKDRGVRARLVELAG